MAEAPTVESPDSTVPELRAPEPASNEQLEHRREKLAARRAAGLTEAYTWDVTSNAAQLHAAYEALEGGQETTDPVSMAGRLMLIRRHGKLTFTTLEDRTGDVQLFVDAHNLTEEQKADFDHFDRGDVVGASGTVMRTRRGELSVKVTAFALLGKDLRPLPDKDKPLTDVETRSRQRYVDLIVNEQTRRDFDIRRKALRGIRNYLDSQGFWEVEGPMLQMIQGGASARPFITHHNALNLDMYLRIALELHLKRLIVGGMERVFEIGRVFRNEGIDLRHNPEFTMLEAYQAYTDYEGCMDLVEGIIGAAVDDALGEASVVQWGGQPLEMKPPYPRLRMDEMIKDHTGAVMDPMMPVEEARLILDGMALEYEPAWGPGKMMKQVYDEKVQHDVRGPVFCIDYPHEVSPLARLHRTRPGYTERFELIIAGSEICNAYSEQNDPVVQLAAFEEEARAKQQGDPEAGDVDYDYVRALEYGMPCTGGIGIGIDRLVMLLSGQESIREVILFPTLRPEPGMGGVTVAPTAGGTPALASVSAIGTGSMGPAALQPALEAEPRSTWVGRKRARLVAWLTAAGGILLLLSLVPRLHDRLLPAGELVFPLWFKVTAHVVVLGIGVGAIYLADQLAKQKKRAWQLAFLAFAIGIVANNIRGIHPIATAYCVLMVVLLIAFRSAFVAAANPPSLFTALRAIPIYLAIVFSFGWLFLLVERNQLTPELTFWGGMQAIVTGLVGIDTTYAFDRRFAEQFFSAAMLSLGIAGVLGFAYLVFKPLAAARGRSDDEWSHAQRLVKTYGWDTLAYFALRPDKSFFFSSDGEAMIAYTFISGYALVSGDPIGAPTSVPLVVDEFDDECRRRAWKPAYLAVREADLPMYEARGFKHFYLGDEAIIRCDRFTLDGRDMKGVRSAVRKVGRDYHFRIFKESEASDTLVDQLNAISARWRGKAPERGFTMTLSQDVEGHRKNPDFLLCVAVGKDGTPGGFLRIVPAYGVDFGYTLDLMRHDPDAPNGMTEYLIGQTALALQERGVSRLSMNFAFFGRLFEGTDLPFSQRIAKQAVGVLNPFFQIQSLHDFNEKFKPEWLPRCIVFKDGTDLPRVGILYAGAEGFLSVPGLGELFVPKPVGRVSADADSSSAA